MILNSNLTFFEAFNKAKKIYKNNDLILYELIFYLSKKVKNKMDFISNRNNKIDFNLKKYLKLLKDYFENEKPLSQITKKTIFLSNEFDILKKQFCPREETEIVCLEGIKWIKKIFKKQNVSVVDFCCGTGVIGISIAKKCKNVNLTLIDINKDAIKNSQINLKKNKIKANCIKGSFDELFFKNKYDVLFCNPPYVNLKDVKLPLKKYENKIAFNNSKDELYFYKKIISNYKSFIKNLNKFLIVFEIGYDQKKPLTNFLKTKNLKYIFKKDISGKDRILIIYNY